MQTIPPLLALLVVLPCLASAQISGFKAKMQASSMSRQLELKPYIKAIKKGEANPKHIAIIRAILKNTNEVCIHQQNGASDNKVFVHQDGHREAVYGKDGKLVQDGINDGTYNYYSASEEPLLHFTFDTSPWISLGTTRSDPTTVKSRIYAYMGDLEGGIGRTLAEGTGKPQTAKLKTGQVEALAVFLRAIDEGNASGLFSLFESRDGVTNDELIDVLTKLNVGLNRVYSANE